MAEAAFKSTSRRTTSATPTNSSKKDPLRRSRSVSAVPRSTLLDTTPSSSPSTEFLVTRENPLYWTSSYSLPEEKNSSSQVDSFQKSNPELKSKSFETSGDFSRGRSVGRSGNSGSAVVAKRSLSRATPDATGSGRRGRSVSRGPVSRGARSVYTSESEVEQERSNVGSLGRLRGRNDSNGRLPMAGRKNDLGRSSSFTQLDGLSSNLPSSPRLSWEDNGISSGGSFSEAEERIIKAVYEQMKSFEGGGLGADPSSQIYETVRSEVRRAIADIQNDLGSAIRSNASTIATANVTDIPPDLVNPSAVELVLDIRREYAKKLEQSQERARKLRADLDVEERRGLELSRILKEVLPDPKTTNVHRSRPGRKQSSIERRRMSERLTEEAMAFFDECISLSTFDSSDFSSPEDPPFNLFGGSPLGDTTSSSQPNCISNSHTIDGQDLVIASDHNLSAPSASSIPKEHPQEEGSFDGSESLRRHRSPFSFGSEPHDTFELQKEIKVFLKNCDKGNEKAKTNLQTRQLELYDPDEYMRSSPESMLFDMVNLKNRIDSGGMLLCGGGFSTSLSTFASFI